MKKTKSLSLWTVWISDLIDGLACHSDFVTKAALRGWEQLSSQRM